MRVSTMVALVAQREITTRLRSKVYWFATIITVVVLVGLSVISGLLKGGQKTYEVGVIPSTASLAAPMQASVASLGQKVTVSTVADEATGRDEVRAGKLDALLVGPGDRVQVVVHKSLDSNLTNAMHLLAGNL